MLKTFWLFQTNARGLSRGRQWAFWLWNAFWVVVPAVCLGALSLLYAYGNYADHLFISYFQNGRIAALNIVPVVILLAALYLLLGRPWLSFLTGGIVVLGFSFANYLKLRFRDDPVMFEDILYIREALGISKTAGYDLTPDGRMLFGLLCLVLGTAVLFFIARGRPGWKARLPLLAALLLGAFSLRGMYTNNTLYRTKTANEAYINRWSATQVYLSKGFVYPFLHSASAGQLKPPEGYSQARAEALLGQYADDAIETPVDIITLQLEAFSDFSRLGIQGVDFSLYDAYHALEEEGVAGELITNIFAGGTVDTERCFLTGLCSLPSFRTDTNSHAWYLRTQGYALQGSHPSYEWFYNRRNINGNLGLDDYYFYENHYADLSTAIAGDGVLLPEILRLYREEPAPCFSFNVTYQGHGPYDTEEVWRGKHFTDGRYSTETTNIVDNYLGSVADTIENLTAFVEELRQEERPVVLVVYGDHQPWLGDGNSAWQEIGVNLDLSTEEGFRNYYGTRYLIWANDAAKDALGQSFRGEGPTLSSCFLMNEVFAQCGWRGSAYLQATETIRAKLPVITSVGKVITADGTLTAAPEGEDAQALADFRTLEYYWAKHFAYGQ